MASAQFKQANSWRWRDLRYLLAPALLLLAVWGLRSDPASLGLYGLGVFLGFVALDLLWPGPRHVVSAGAGSATCRALLRLYAVTQLAAQCFAMVVAWQAGWQIALSLALGMGLLAGTVGSAVAHELGHSPAPQDKLLSWLMMWCLCYPGFMVEHYRGHHPWAATWDDPTSAREGESLWRFLPRAVTDGLTSAIALERQRLVQRQQTWLHSPLVWALGANALLVLCLVGLLAWSALLFWLVQCVLAIALLEAVQYVEHYGLYREGLDVMRAPFLAAHAWNASAPLSTSLLVNRSLHSDHHLNPWKPFPQLELPLAPGLPTGYPGCVLLAAVPPLWYAVMHPRLVEVQRQAQAFESEAGV